MNDDIHLKSLTWPGCKLLGNGPTVIAHAIDSELFFVRLLYFYPESELPPTCNMMMRSEPDTDHHSTNISNAYVSQVGNFYFVPIVLVNTVGLISAALLIDSFECTKSTIGRLRANLRKIAVLLTDACRPCLFYFGVASCHLLVVHFLLFLGLVVA